jgi:hypothetical protein
MGWGRRDRFLPVLESVSATTDLDLISYFKTITDARMRRGVRIPAWYLLLVAVLGIYCFAEGWRLEPLPEHARPGAFCNPPLQRVDRGAGPGAQGTAFRFSLVAPPRWPAAR